VVTAYVNLRRGDSQPGTQTAYRITVSRCRLTLSNPRGKRLKTKRFET